jgi:hypothetical protein
MLFAPRAITSSGDRGPPRLTAGLGIEKFYNLAILIAFSFIFWLKNNSKQIYLLSEVLHESSNSRNFSKFNI